MQTDYALRIFDQVAKASGKGKESLLRDYDVEYFLKAAYDPFKQYGIKKMPDVSRHGSQPMPVEDLTELLDNLSSRRLTGNAAKVEVKSAMTEYSAESAELLARILQKDLRCGINVKTINSVFPGLIPEFGCQLAHKYSEKRAKFPMIVQPKLDGVRVIANVDAKSDVVLFFSRTGREFTTFDHLKDPLLKSIRSVGLESATLDGEMVSGNFNKTVGDVRRKSEQAGDAVFYVFDIIDDAHRHLPYRERLRALEKFEFDHPLRALKEIYVHCQNEVDYWYQSFRDQGYEGIVIKDTNAPYEHKRSYAWMKIKDLNSVDVPIVGAIEGTGKYVGMLGALIVDVNGIQVNVGSGISDRDRQSIWDVWKYGEDEILGRIVEVEYHEMTPDLSLRHPRLKGFRDYLVNGEKV